MPRGYPKQKIQDATQTAMIRQKRAYTKRHVRRTASFWLAAIEDLQDKLAEACADKAQLQLQLDMLKETIVGNPEIVANFIGDSLSSFPERRERRSLVTSR